ncbi:MAG TPA: glutathione S-transferase N-terminal domain-containing protein [Polyangiaceae bacterium]|nr:glutathione S-transferase N-terminal domain-containing protein [Polyangiaceae bacterium]
MTRAQTTVQLHGRSSSHFTRVARIFAVELAVPLDFRPVLDLTTLEPSAYAGNPALKIPVLVDEQGPLFGIENICRALLRRSGKAATNIIMRGDLAERAIANAEELTLHVMSSEVSLLMAKAAGNVAPPKAPQSLHNSLRYLDETLGSALAELPSDRLLSFLEVTLFCVVTHLEFREMADVSLFHALREFCLHFGERESAKATPYRFDVA